MVSGRCVEGVWKMSKRSQEGVRKVSGRCLEDVKAGVWKLSREAQPQLLLIFNNYLCTREKRSRTVTWS